MVRGWCQSGSRAGRHVWLAVCALACTSADISAVQAAGSAGGISGIWTLKDYKSPGLRAERRRLLTIDGTAPPLQPWAESLYRQRIADSDRENTSATRISSSCLPRGVPLMMMVDNRPIQILQTPTQVTLLFEEQRTYRVVKLNESQPSDPDPTYYGYSVGHFEGDVLVVDTIGLNDRTTLDLAGLPHSEALHVVERIRRVDADTLEDLITVDDPATFTRPWTMRERYASFKGQVMENVCDGDREQSTADKGSRSASNPSSSSR